MYFLICRLQNTVEIGIVGAKKGNSKYVYANCDFLSKPELPLIHTNSTRTPRVSSVELYVCIKTLSVRGRIATCHRYTVLSIIMIRKQYDNSPVSMRNPRTYFSYLCKEICKNRTRVLNFNTYHAKRYEIPVA